MRLLLYTLNLISVLLPQLGAQDPIFSQFYRTPHEVNPALLGVHEGGFQANVNYRELYSSLLPDRPFRTIHAAADWRFPIGRNDYFSFGPSIISDQVGEARLNRNAGYLGAAYLRQFSDGRYRGAEIYGGLGAQAGFGQFGIDLTNLWFSQQFDATSGQIDLGTPSGEALTGRSNSTFLDLNVGGVVYFIFDDNQSFYIGAALQHLNQPAIQLIDGSSEALQPKYVGHLGGEIPLFSEDLSFLPSAIFLQQGPTQSITGGGLFRYTRRSWGELAMRAGVFFRTGRNNEGSLLTDAFIVQAILETNGFDVGISYDRTVSTLTAANDGRGAFELSLLIYRPERDRRRKIRCPKL